MGTSAAKPAPQAAPSSAYPTLEDALKAQPSAAPSGEAAATQEREDMLAAQVEEQNQTKVESGSRYKVKLSGLVLMNTYTNRGTVDNTDLPGLALPRPAGQTNGDFGATLRQTLLGLDVTGPKLAGARTAADVQMDFFGGFPSYQYGVTSGLVRLRVARASLDWGSTKLVVGQDAPVLLPAVTHFVRERGRARILLGRKPVGVDATNSRRAPLEPLGDFGADAAGRNSRSADGIFPRHAVRPHSHAGREFAATGPSHASRLEWKIVGAARDDRRRRLLRAASLGIRPQRGCLGRYRGLGSALGPMVRSFRRVLPRARSGRPGRRRVEQHCCQWRP